MPRRDSRLDRASIRMEAGVHGPRWQTLHSGYFSDPAVAAPFLDVVQKAIRDSAPQVIVDLGGGTGFILGELLGRSPGRRVRLVNLDLSQKQLAAESDNRIIRICQSITAFERSEAADRDARSLFIMRSALHYLGRDGLTP